jgi:hypothetical protein
MNSMSMSIHYRLVCFVIVCESFQSLLCDRFKTTMSQSARVSIMFEVNSNHTPLVSLDVCGAVSLLCSQELQRRLRLTTLGQSLVSRRQSRWRPIQLARGRAVLVQHL